MASSLGVLLERVPGPAAANILPIVSQLHFGNQITRRVKVIGFKSQLPLLKPPQAYIPVKQVQHNRLIVVASDASDSLTYDDLKAGSPVMIIEAPPYLKTAEPMPMMRANDGAVMPGDAGRVISRKPKDVWAVRVATGAFLIERKYFKPLKVNWSLSFLKCWGFHKLELSLSWETKT